MAALHLRRFLPAWPVLASLVLGKPQLGEGAAADCDLAPWVSESRAPGEEGYHVLCVTALRTAEVYPSGVMSSQPAPVAFEGSGELRRKLAELLEIKTTIAYQALKPKRKRVEWQKQPWALFTAEGRELRVGSEAEEAEKLLEQQGGRPAVLLLFEGGAWRWPTLRVGYEREVLPGVTLRTVSRQPALFEVRIEDSALGEGKGEQLSKRLLTEVVEKAESQMAPSEMEGRVDKTVRSSESTFLKYSSSPALRTLEAGTAKLLRGYAENLEPLQVLRYTKNQHYDAHRDYWDPREFPDVRRFTNQEGFWNQRHATLLWYLAAPEEGGETWFPRAHGGPIPWDEWMACDARGAMVSPNNATAVLFYSLRADGEIDEFSWHSGCPVRKGVKWAANSWMHNAPERTRPASRRPVHSAEL